MRARLIFIFVAILLLAAFSALNWSEFNRTVPLSFGVISFQAPLGLILLGLLALTLGVFLVSSATQEARYLLEHRRHAKALDAQRVLADTAEASRFTDLRQHLDTHLRENRQREAIAATEFEKAMVQSQRELRTQLEQMNQALVARMGEIESRIDSRLERGNPAVDVSPRPADTLPRDRVKV
jgi:uncharacterized integral membrane protein